MVHTATMKQQSRKTPKQQSGNPLEQRSKGPVEATVNQMHVENFSAGGDTNIASTDVIGPNIASTELVHSLEINSQGNLAKALAAFKENVKEFEKSPRYAATVSQLAEIEAQAKDAQAAATALLATQEAQAAKVVQQLKETKKLEKERKAAAYAYLKKHNPLAFDTSENRKLIDAVVFTNDAIIIGGIPRAKENVKASDVGMDYTPLATGKRAINYAKPHVFIGNPAYPNEDYFTYAAVEEIHKTGKGKVPTYEDMRNTLAALPGWRGDAECPVEKEPTFDKEGAPTLFAILVGCNMSGYRQSGSRVPSERKGEKDGGLWSISQAHKRAARFLIWGDTKGRIKLSRCILAMPLRLLAATH